MSLPPLIRTLNVKLLVPIIGLWVVISLFLFLFVLNPISGFVTTHIQENLQWLSSTSYSICDNSLDQLIRSGRSTDPKQLTIQKVRTLRQIELFFDQNEILGFVYHDPDQAILWQNQLPEKPDRMIPLLKEYNQVIDLDLLGQSYAGYHFSFDAWRWHIILIKKTSHYASFIKKVSRAYMASIGILASSLIMILLVFNQAIKKPINTIIAPLKNNEKPSYRGTVEFEFLSKSIEQMMRSLHQAKQNLEQRVKERTNELRRSNQNLKQAKEELARYNKELEHKVAQRTNEISSILKYTPAVIYMKDIQGNYLLVNSKFEQLFNVSSKTVRGKTDAQILPDKIADSFQKNDEKVLATGSALQVEQTIFHHDLMHTYFCIKFPIYSQTGRIAGICSIASDITELKNVHEQLRQLSGSIMDNQEKERSAIARELHDELGQILTALRMDAVWLGTQLEKQNNQFSEKAMGMCSLIDQTIKDVRNLAVRLRPGVLDDLGLVDALEWYTKDFERRTMISCSFAHGDIPELKGTIATAAYRIAQEALTNVARHAETDTANLSLFVEDRSLVLTIADKGQGFSPLSRAAKKNLGLLGMKERASLVNGSLTVDSDVQQGTQIKFMVDL